MNLVLFHDFETFSEADITCTGAAKYARHPSTEILMLSHLLVDLDKPLPEEWEVPLLVGQWVPAEGQKMPSDLRDMLRDPAVTKQAWNAQFERNIWQHVAGITIPYEQWRCSMVLAHMLSLPGSLDKAGQILRLPEDMLKQDGKSLIRFFSCPRKPTKTKLHTRNLPEHDPKKWEAYKAYNHQDTVTEFAAFRRMRHYLPPEQEWRYWHQDQLINDTGWPINRGAVRGGLQVLAAETERLMEHMRDITQLDNPNSGAQLLPWLQERGYPYEDLKKGHVGRAFKEAESYQIDDDAKDVLESRLQAAKAAVKKYVSINDATDDEDDRLRGTLQFAGAGRTWRWAGRITQFQNLSRPEWYLAKADKLKAAVNAIEHFPEMIPVLYDKPMEVLSSCVRPLVQAPKGFKLAVADLNAIETRVIAWLCGCEKLLSVFRDGRCPYVDFATHMFDQPYDVLYAEYKAGDKTKRTTAKPGVLGCGYMLSAGKVFENSQTGELEATGLLGYGWNMGVDLTMEQAQLSVDTYRNTYVEVVDYWWEIDRAAKRTVVTGQPHSAGIIEFDRKGPFLRMKLPSGRYLHYLRPAMLDKKTPWGAMKPQLHYEGYDDKKQWRLISTHPGKLVENAVQAIARDILANGIEDALNHDVQIVGHVHDEIISVVEDDLAQLKFEQLKRSMTLVPEWAPGLFLGAEGYIDTVYMKD